MYSIINIDLNVPCYFASIQKTINDYLINNILNQKVNYLFHTCMLKLNESHMNVIHVQNDESIRFNEGVSIIINFK